MTIISPPTEEPPAAAVMVPESELVGRLQEYLRTADLTTTTTASVRRQLEQDFGIDLTDKKAFIRQQIDLFLETQQPKEEENDDDEDENDKKKKKMKKQAMAKLELVENEGQTRITRRRRKKGEDLPNYVLFLHNFRNLQGYPSWQEQRW